MKYIGEDENGNVYHIYLDSISSKYNRIFDDLDFNVACLIEFSDYESNRESVHGVKPYGCFQYMMFRKHKTDRLYRISKKALITQNGNILKTYPSTWWNWIKRNTIIEKIFEETYYEL